MTSNVGAEMIKKQNVMGFGAPDLQDNHEALREKLMEEAKKSFKPEFLNRLDDVIVFHPLNKTALTKIIDLEVAKVLERIKNKNIHVKLNKAAHELLIEKGYDPTYGARPMRRAVERLLENPMAEEILRGTIKPGDHVSVSCDGKKFSFKVKQAATKKVSVN